MAIRSKRKCALSLILIFRSPCSDELALWGSMAIGANVDPCVMIDRGGTVLRHKSAKGMRLFWRSVPTSDSNIIQSHNMALRKTLYDISAHKGRG